MAEIREIPIRKIKVGEHAQRMEKEDDDIGGLAASIGRLGLLVPLIIQKKGDNYLLVSGHRRLMASKKVGLQNIPCIIRESDEDETNEVTFAENYFRKDLSPVELACALKDCCEKQTLSIKEMAEGFHRSEHWIHSMIAIAGWPADVQEAIHAKELSVSAASNLALVTDSSYRTFLVRNAVEQGATARTTASWLQAWRAMQPADEAITSEPVPGHPVSIPAVPQAPCLCCARMYEVNKMSHVPICGECIPIIREVGISLAKT